MFIDWERPIFWVGFSFFCNTLRNTNELVVKLGSSLTKIKIDKDIGIDNIAKTNSQFEQIIGSVSEIKSQNEKMNLEIVSFVNVINDMSNAIEEVTSSSDELSLLVQS